MRYTSHMTILFLLSCIPSGYRVLALPARKRSNDSSWRREIHSRITAGLLPQDHASARPFLPFWQLQPPIRSQKCIVPSLEPWRLRRIGLVGTNSIPPVLLLATAVAVVAVVIVAVERTAAVHTVAVRILAEHTVAVSIAAERMRIADKPSVAIRQMRPY